MRNDASTMRERFAANLRLVCPMPRGVDGIEPQYQGEVLDVSSRAAVRRIVTSWVKKGAWARY